MPSRRRNASRRNKANEHPRQSETGVPEITAFAKETNVQEKRSIAIVESDDGAKNVTPSIVTESEKNVLKGSPTKKRNAASSRFIVEASPRVTSITLIKQAHEVAPSTPPKGKNIHKKGQTSNANLVTPSSSDSSIIKQTGEDIEPKQSTARRSLVMPPLLEVTDVSSFESSSTSTSSLPSSDEENGAAIASSSSSEDIITDRRPFESTIAIQPNTRKVYAIVNKMTGKIGGNGHGGAIYGELTIGSMQKMVDMMKVYTNLNKDSRFIDVGCGLGKPNLHVAQDPGVMFSYGIEMEHVRWILGMSNLNQTLEAANNQLKSIDEEERIGHRCIFEHGDITEAEYFDPFTHVYMFDIGFPPKLFEQLADMFNKSHSPYLICYHGPKLMIERYGFDIELITQVSTSMHGSSECHTGYLYRRNKENMKSKRKKKCQLITNDFAYKEPCDPLFVSAWASTQHDLGKFSKQVKKTVLENLSSQRPRRNRKPTNKDIYISSALSKQ